jgi:hypothetical protein
MKFGTRGFVLAATVVVGACHEPPPAGPTPFPGTGQAQPPDVAVTVVDGWDNAPVAAARVTIHDQSFVTDARGSLIVPRALSGSTMDVDAVGFLPRRTYFQTVNPTTLWRVTEEREAEAIRDFVFFRDQSGTYVLPSLAAYTVALDTSGLAVEGRVAAEAAWREVLGTLGELRLPFVVGNPPFGDWGVVASFTPMADESCVPARWGVCWYYPRDPGYYSTTGARIRADPAAWYPTILRALIYGALNQYSPGPGLLSRDDPAHELSLFERRALKMMSLRRPGHLWPDRDRGR